MNDQERWAAVERRDAAQDGAFVYAVKSTGIYCRPSCPSRRPRRDNVSFYAGPDAAEAAGFRACRRCHPRDYANRDDTPDWVQAARDYLDAHLDEPVRLEALGRQVGVSVFHLQRTFKAVVGLTPRQYVDAQRLAHVKSSLKAGERVTGALYDAGYSSSSRLYERAHAQFGMTPDAYRKGGAGVNIRYTIEESSLGKLMVAGTDKGICFLSLGDSERKLVDELRGEFPAAQIERDGKHLARWARDVLRYLDGRQTALDLPLDVQATVFQWRVWRALQSIPYGETRTYSQIARMLGNPKAQRAVGHACATNPVSLVIPCHRAVRTDGGLGGYRWGLDRKERLIAHEKAIRE
ncbi:MAG: bifunctional DNA-binding transcriptional regulator/O6-methylguanine-DNA methyltransferase Ada [Chloroflexi bacterium]|nr:bifunctional DNA-binding transcriptional regulator/O6-methylguanine-DNA methyltransferase Ada [Chloroflexota bacterium]